MFSRRNFLPGCAFLLPQLARKRADSKPASALSPIRFRELAQRSGLDFILQNNPTPRKHMIETMLGGVAAFDYNDDGRVDIFLTNGASIPSLEKDSREFFNRWYRNDGGMKFTDVTSEAGVAGAGYSMGRRRRTVTTTAIPICLWRASTATFFTATWATESSKTLRRKRESKAISPVEAGWFDYLRAGGTRPHGTPALRPNQQYRGASSTWSCATPVRVRDSSLQRLQDSTDRCNRRCF
jgi:hypothetical protein